MWIVRLALRRPYTFVVLALAIILLTPVVLLRTPVDIFPDINIPVISLVWTYNGLQPQEMEQRITSNVERGVTTLVSDVEHIESQSLNGIAVIKVFFQPGANIQTALAQTAAISQTFLRFLPPGTTPPLVRSEEHTSELQSPDHLVCRLLLEKKKAPSTCTRPIGFVFFTAPCARFRIPTSTRATKPASSEVGTSRGCNSS